MITDAEFTQMYAEHSVRLLAFVRSRFGAEDAEDIASQAWLNAWKHRGAFRAECRFSSWLTRIAINHGMELRTRGKSAARRQRELPLTPHTASAVRAACNVERDLLRKESLELALSQVVARDAGIMRMRFVLGFDLHDIADASHLSVNTVKVRLTRACQKLAV